MGRRLWAGAAGVAALALFVKGICGPESGHWALVPVAAVVAVAVYLRMTRFKS
jgi:hypothetical protein